MEDLSGEPLERFLERLASARAGPAAGSAAAVVGALAAAVAGMVARLSRDRVHDGAELVDQADALRRRALRLAEADARASAAMVDLQRTAGGDTDDPRVRRAVEEATRVPREIGELAAEVAALAEALDPHAPAHLGADLVAVHRLAAAAAQVTEAVARSNLDT